MKVLSVSTHCNIGGISNYMLTLAKALTARGVETLIATSGGNLEGELRRAGIPHRTLAIDTKFELHPKVFLAALRLRRIVEDEKVDIIHAHTRVSQVAALLAARLTGVPFVTTCHGYFRRRLRKVFDTWGSTVIAISGAVKQHLEEDLGVDAGRIALVYSGVDTARFDGEMSDDEVREAKRSLGLKDGPVVGTIGRLSPVKGQAYLVDALALLIAKRPAIQGLIIGDGAEKEALRSRARALGIEDSVRFVSSNVDTRRFLSLMDVFVFPSVKEGLGIALLEALAAGRACVASRIGGIGDIITDGLNGLLTAVGDPPGIAGAVLRLIDDPALCRTMGQAGRRLVADRFTVERMADEVLKVYRQTVREEAR